MDVAPATGMYVHMKDGGGEDSWRLDRVAGLKARLLTGLADGGGRGGFPGIHMAARLEPYPQALMPMQEHAPRTDDHG